MAANSLLIPPQCVFQTKVTIKNTNPNNFKISSLISKPGPSCFLQHFFCCLPQMFSVCSTRNVSLNKSIRVLKKRSHSNIKKPKSKIFQTRSHGLNSEQLLLCSLYRSQPDCLLVWCHSFLKDRL